MWSRTPTLSRSSASTWRHPPPQYYDPWQQWHQPPPPPGLGYPMPAGFALGPQPPPPPPPAPRPAAPPPKPVDQETLGFLAYLRGTAKPKATLARVKTEMNFGRLLAGMQVEKEAELETAPDALKMNAKKRKKQGKKKQVRKKDRLQKIYLHQKYLSVI